MKKHLFSLIALGLLFATGSAYAQSITVKANIPFDFVVDKQTMPKGEYRVETIGSEGSNVLLITSADGTSKRLETVHSAQSVLEPMGSKLVFHRYGSDYFLSEVWSSNAGSGYEFRQGRLEKELAKASSKSNVAVAALR
jgi:hypothetical protein